MSDQPGARTLAEVNAAGPWADQWAAVDVIVALLDQLAHRHRTGRVGGVSAEAIAFGDDGGVHLSTPGVAGALPGDDVADAGALLYQMLTGHRAGSMVGAPAEAALRLRGDIDGRLARVVARSISADPGERFGDAETFREALSALRVPLSGGTELRRVSLTGGEPGPVGVQRPAAPRRAAWTAIITVLSLVVAGGLAWLLTRDDDSRGGDGTSGIVIPDLAGRTSADAQAQLTALRLNPFLIQEPSVAVAQDAVIRTSPAAGVRAPEGSRVIVVVSGQPSAGIVPSLVGLEQSQAASVASQSGLTTTTTQVADAAPAGQVIRQSPDPGVTLPSGSSVAITVSSGPGAATTPGVTTTSTFTAPSTGTTTVPSGTQVAVPDVAGEDLDTATSVLLQAGLASGTVQYQASVIAPGAVISQSPAAGVSVAPGTAVNLLVAE